MIMKTRMTKYISALCLATVLFTACLSDLDSLPLDNNILVGEEVYSTADGYIGVLAKCYASLILTGQKGPDGDKDVPNIDEGYSGYTRALYYLQNACTDESAFHSGSSAGTRALLFHNWDPSTQIISFAYYRLYISINICNEFLSECTESKLKSRGVYDDLKDEYEYFRAEARLIRAYAYSMLCDLYGSVPFVDEDAPLGSIPEQKSRMEVFTYAVAETEAIVDELKAPGRNEYGRVDQVAAWFLLSRMYINAESWVGLNEYENAYKYAKKIIEDGSYPLAPDYRHIFLADNNTCKEIIWPLVQDNDHTYTHAGTSFLIKALINGTMAAHYKSGINNTWGNARAKTTLVNLFEESDQTFNVNDPWGNEKKDKRAQFFSGVESDPNSMHTKETWTDRLHPETGQHYPFQNDFNQGYAIMKWRNVRKDGSELAAGGTVYSSIDFPLFRTADAYLMAAEAILRGASGSKDEALQYVNEIRDRAYMSGKYGPGESGRITAGQLTLDFLIDERGRELHTELTRRTDLIRFDKFTKGYNWDWKGGDGSYASRFGTDVSDKYKLYPIPGDEFTSNPNLTQNPDFVK